MWSCSTMIAHCLLMHVSIINHSKIIKRRKASSHFCFLFMGQKVVENLLWTFWYRFSFRLFFPQTHYMIFLEICRLLFAYKIKTKCFIFVPFQAKHKTQFVSSNSNDNNNNTIKTKERHEHLGAKNNNFFCFAVVDLK